jgi:hypothetical protein
VHNNFARIPARAQFFDDGVSPSDSAMSDARQRIANGARIVVFALAKTHGDGIIVFH